jgi:hypothetical protein
VRRHSISPGITFKAVGLRALPVDRIVSWGFGDFIFNCEFNVVSDMGKIRRAGFVEPAYNELWFQTALTGLQEKKIIPSA